MGKAAAPKVAWPDGYAGKGGVKFFAIRLVFCMTKYNII